MDDSLQSTSPLGAADQMMGITAVHLVLIVIFAILAVIALWWGTRLVRKRREGIERLEEDNRLERVERDAPVPAPADTQEKRAETPPPPAHPAPPPIAEGEAFASPEPAPVPPAEAAPVPPASPEAAPKPVAPEPAPTAAPAPAPAPVPAPAASDGDTLTTLKGVGPKVAAKLNDLGIRRFADLAALSPEQAAAIDAEMGNFKGRMERDRWQEQAALLAAGDKAGYEAKFGKLG